MTESISTDKILDLATENKTEQRIALTPYTLSSKPSQWGIERAHLYERNAEALLDAAVEIERLRAVLRAAPHGEECRMLELGFDNCWKADA